MTLLDRVQLRWSFADIVPWPIRSGWLLCPVCRSNAQYIKAWRFHQHRDPDHEVRERCDVQVKCTDCSFNYVFGVPVPAWMYWYWQEFRLVKRKELDRHQGNVFRLKSDIKRWDDIQADQHFMDARTEMGP